MKIAKLREYGSELGREGMAKLAQEFLSQYDGSYKGVMELCGKLAQVGKMATCDEYWNEQVVRGEHKALFAIESPVIRGRLTQTNSETNND